VRLPSVVLTSAMLGKREHLEDGAPQIQYKMRHCWTVCDSGVSQRGEPVVPLPAGRTGKRVHETNLRESAIRRWRRDITRSR